MLGSVFSLAAAFFWAGGVILFKKSGEVFSPVTLNIYKSIVALILVSLTMVVTGIDFIPDKPSDDWAMLALSGFLGITLADLFFFMALNRLGAGLMAIVECLYLPCVILFSFLLLNENLSIGGMIGGMMVLSAVFLGSYVPRSKKMEIDKNPHLLSGIIYGFLAMFFVALGIVIIKRLLDHTDVLWANFVRVSAGVVTLMIIVMFHPKRRKYFQELKFSRAWLLALPASVSGNYLALLCWVAGMKYTTASQAAILNQMSTIFIFIMAAVFLNERITRYRTIAILLALAGACLTIFS